MEKIKVAHDGFGGLIVLECSERVEKEIRSCGLHDVAETDQINVPGVFEVTLSEETEECDCCSGYVHGCYVIFDVHDVQRIGDLMTP